MMKKLNMEDIREEMEWSCPNCYAMWSIEEFDEQRCYCCGYPEEDDEYDEYDQYQESTCRAELGDVRYYVGEPGPVVIHADQRTKLVREWEDLEGDKPSLEDFVKSRQCG